MQNDLDPKGLLPCKVCNSDDWTIMCPGGHWHVECNDCGYITSQHFHTEADAIAAWNRRHLSAVPDGEGELVDADVERVAVAMHNTRKAEDSWWVPWPETREDYRRKSLAMVRTGLSALGDTL